MANNDIEEIKASIAVLTMTMQRIETSVCGDDRSGIPGVFKRIDKNELNITENRHNIYKINNKVNKAIWMLSGGITVILIIWAVFKELSKFI